MYIYKSVLIEVGEPSPIDGGPLDDIFGRSQAISEAVAKFWEMKLATAAKLGEVTKTAAGYKVEILY